jgi:acetyl-CoA carboxylase biotin carboxyl carrier protein
MTPEDIKALALAFEKVPGMKGIDYKDVKRLADLLRQSPEIGMIELKGWFGTGVVISRTATGMPIPMMAGAAPMMTAPPPAAESGEPARPAPSTLKEIKSPMVGTYESAPEPGAEPYVQTGSRVTPGLTVCIIEAMKIMNEIEAEFGGVVREVLVDDAQPVEFGQVLFRVDPNG